MKIQYELLEANQYKMAGVDDTLSRRELAAAVISRIRNFDPADREGVIITVQQDSSSRDFELPEHFVDKVKSGLINNLILE